MSKVAEARKNRTLALQERIQSWVKFYNVWLANNHVTPKEAADMAYCDGIIDATPRRLSLAAGAIKADWLHHPSGKRKRALRKSTKLSAAGWARLDRAIMKIDLSGCKTVSEVATWLAVIAKVRQPVSVVGEALRARKIYLPDRTDRPTWSKDHGER